MSAPYLDPGHSADERTADLLGRMTVEEKAGLMFHPMALVSPAGELTDTFDPLAIPATEDAVVSRRVNHLYIVGSTDPSDIARWHNRVQEVAESTRLRIPVTISTDPRHAFTRILGTGAVTEGFSSWPQAIGFAALGDESLVERFADVVRRDYLAVGIRLALHPQADLATEPRWMRVAGTYGEDSATVAALTAAQLRGLHGAVFGDSSISTMTKHFPGCGPQRDGEDPRFAYGKEQDYPGGRMEDHVAPFVAAIAAGTRQILLSYGVPTWPGSAGVGFCFDRDVVTGILRERLGFDGIVSTDWGVINDLNLLGQDMPAPAWGLEELTPEQRILRALEAGVDQFGGEYCPELVVDLVRGGAVTQDRLDASAARILHEKFALGLFDRRRVDVDRVPELVGQPRDVATGREMQTRSLTVLGDSIGLPLAPGTAVHLDGLEPIAFDGIATVVGPEQAQVTIVRVEAPFEPRAGGFEALFHAGSLELDDGAAAALSAKLAARPAILVVDLDRPAILRPHMEADVLIAAFGASDQAIADGLFGPQPMEGRLPFDLPSSEAHVQASRTDVAFDTESPLFKRGFRARG